MVKVSVVGATGYTGEELVNILLKHGEAELSSLSGLVEKKIKYAELLPRFSGRTQLYCDNLDIDSVSSSSELVFLALPHTVSMTVAPKFLKKNKKVIDLSADYRLDEVLYNKWYGKEHLDKGNIKEAVYGLPELFPDEIKSAGLIANPGCYPTGAILALAPAVKHGLAEKGNIIIDSKSGATGAGRKAHISLCFSEVNESLKAYKINSHQHMPEIESILSKTYKKDVKVNFIPHLIPMNRGILSSIYVPKKKGAGEDEVFGIYREFYKDKKFVRILPKGRFPEVKNIVNTNYCDIGIKCEDDLLIIISCIDNLWKGASGQAVQNMNIMCGFDETEGLL